MLVRREPYVVEAECWELGNGRTLGMMLWKGKPTSVLAAPAETVSQSPGVTGYSGQFTLTTVFLILSSSPY